ncbi:hypothetical protein WJX81_003569 [Elliptochloris bilobata]|uniref:DNA topoisomerase n=1 Tax=Elliptochloris bilobata TaxID=381761 RepID=A0AAW1R275_9CHLO
MPIKVLNVAEKNSIAVQVSSALSNSSAHRQASCSKYNPLFFFPYNINGTPCEMVFTSVAGHLLELDFTPQHKKWHGCSPAELYTAPVQKVVPQDKQAIERNLQQQARGAQWLVLWLDCDREGENIAFEVIEEIDLRIGASFTRFQTLLLQDKFDFSATGLQGDREKLLISYGPCQFPTLGLIVQREWEVQSHVAERFWSIHMSYQAPATAAGGCRCQFEWRRVRLFDHVAASVLYELCCEDPLAAVLRVAGEQRLRWPPYPLATLAMQKLAITHLRLSGERIMKLAEELYQEGFISYPRTETDVFDPDYDLMALVQQHTGDARWGPHAQRIASGQMWHPPRPGGNNDQAHPPIHPTRYTQGEGSWPQEKARLYEFIVRSFLATCSKPAVGFETRVEVDIAGELFDARGLMVRERNWLDVYPYTSWGGRDALPVFQDGQTFIPHELLLKDGMTQPPPRLSERNLIAAMERHGIGTDATVADHIKKQLDRGYATEDAQALFWPTHLGEALVGSYCKMGLSNLWQPNLRGLIERNITAVAQGRRSKEEVLAEAVQCFRADFMIAAQKQGMMEAEVAQFFPRAAGGGGGGDAALPPDGQPLGPCPRCGLPLLLCRREGEVPFVACSGVPLCRLRVFLPRGTLAAEAAEAVCGACQHGAVRKLALRFRAAALPMGYDTAMTAMLPTAASQAAGAAAATAGGGSAGSASRGGRGPAGGGHAGAAGRGRAATERGRGRQDRGRGRSGHGGAATAGNGSGIRGGGRGSARLRGREPGRRGSGAGRAPTYVSATGQPLQGGLAGNCYICRQEGHWANNCPNR